MKEDVIGEKAVSTDFSPDLASTLCELLRRGGDECVQPDAGTKVRVYRCCQEDRPCGIRFGTLERVDVNNHYSLEPPSTVHPYGKRAYVTLTPANIHDYFETQPE